MFSRTRKLHFCLHNIYIYKPERRASALGKSKIFVCLKDKQTDKQAVVVCRLLLINETSYINLTNCTVRLWGKDKKSSC